MPWTRRDNRKLFLDRVYPEPNTGCWFFCGSYTTDGYGRLTPEYFNGFSKAHRFSYFLAKGEFDRTLCVLHACDMPCCVNTEHLFLGTNDENMADMVKKGRSPLGIRNAKNKLTIDQVLQIRKLGSSKLPLREIAAKFNVGKTQVSYIIKRKSWAHLK